MHKYFYKQFEISYEIKPNQEMNLFEAHASVTCLINKENPTLAHEFSTQASTANKVEAEIKKLIKGYIDFEWKQSTISYRL